MAESLDSGSASAKKLLMIGRGFIDFEPMLCLQVYLITMPKVLQQNYHAHTNQNDEDGDENPSTSTKA